MPQVTTRINGANWHEGAQTKLNTLGRGTPIDLEREPGNEHDGGAIRCSRDGVLLGYVRAKDNRGAAAAMDRGEEVTCRIHPCQPMIVLSWPSTMPAGLRGIVRGS